MDVQFHTLYNAAQMLGVQSSSIKSQIKRGLVPGAVQQPSKNRFGGRWMVPLKWVEEEANRIGKTTLVSRAKPMTLNGRPEDAIREVENRTAKPSPNPQGAIATEEEKSQEEEEETEEEIEDSDEGEDREEEVEEDKELEEKKEQPMPAKKIESAQPPTSSSSVGGIPSSLERSLPSSAPLTAGVPEVSTHRNRNFQVYKVNQSNQEEVWVGNLSTYPNDFPLACKTISPGGGVFFMRYEEWKKEGKKPGAWQTMVTARVNVEGPDLHAMVPMTQMGAMPQQGQWPQPYPYPMGQPMQQPGMPMQGPGMPMQPQVFMMPPPSQPSQPSAAESGLASVAEKLLEAQMQPGEDPNVQRQQLHDMQNEMEKKLQQRFDAELAKEREEKNTLGDRHQREVDILTTRLKAQADNERLFYEHASADRVAAAEQRAHEQEEAAKEREKDRERFYDRMAKSDEKRAEESKAHQDKMLDLERESLKLQREAQDKVFAMQEKMLEKDQKWIEELRKLRDSQKPWELIIRTLGDVGSKVGDKLEKLLPAMQQQQANMQPRMGMPTPPTQIAPPTPGAPPVAAPPSPEPQPQAQPPVPTPEEVKMQLRGVADSEIIQAVKSNGEYYKKLVDGMAQCLSYGVSPATFLAEVAKSIPKEPSIPFVIRAISRLPNPMIFLEVPYAEGMDEGKIKRIHDDGAGWVANLQKEMANWVAANPGLF